MALVFKNSAGEVINPQPPTDSTAPPADTAPPHQTSSEASTRPATGDISSLVRNDTLPDDSPYTGLRLAPESEQMIFKETGQLHDATKQFLYPDPKTGEKKVYERDSQLKPGGVLTMPARPEPSFTQKVQEWWRDQPGTYYSPFFPVKKDEDTGELSPAFPGFFRSLVRGTAELIGAAGGELPYGQDLSDDAKAAVFTAMTGQRPFRAKAAEVAAPPIREAPGVEKFADVRQSPGPAGIAPSWQREARPRPKLSVGGAVAAAALPLRRAFAHVADLNKDALVRSDELANQGYRVAPSAYAPGMARWQRWVDLSISLKADPLARGATRLAETGVQETLERAGYDPLQAEQMRVHALATESPALEPAGKAVKAAASADRQRSIANLQSQIGDIRTSSRQTGLRNVRDHEAKVRAVQQTLRTYNATLDREIAQNWADVNRTRATDPAGLASNVAESIRGIRSRVSDAAEQMYDAADAAAGDALINVRNSSVMTVAQEFVDQMSPELRASMPRNLFRNIQSFLGGEESRRTAAGLDIPPGRMTFGELRFLRSQLRDLGDNPKLTPSFRRGPYMHMANVVDDLLHDQTNHPEIRQATQLLDQADAFYAKEMARFRDNTVQGLVDNVRAGFPPDPQTISRQIMQGGAGNEARLREIVNIAGPEVTQQIRSADLEDIIASSQVPLTQEVDPKALLKEVNHRYSNGTLQVLYGPQEARDIMRLSQRLAARAGHYPIEHLEQGDFRHFLGQANLVQDELARLAKPKFNAERMMEAAAKEGQARAKEATAAFKEGRRADILSPYTNPQLMASAAAQELLEPKNVARLREAITRWGPDSDAVKKLRLVALERIVAPLARKEPLEVLSTLEGMPREQQELLFPGQMADDIKQVASDLRLIYGKTVPGMPGFATGATLDAPLMRYLHKIAVIEGMAFLVTSRPFIHGIATLMRAGGRNAVIGRELLRDRFRRWMTASLMLSSPEYSQDQQGPDWLHDIPVSDWRERAGRRARPPGAPGSDWRSRIPTIPPT